MILRHVPKFLLVAVAWSVAAMVHAERPVLLVAQITVGNAETNLMLDAVLADELDRVGQVSTVIWSMTDPVVRALDADGKISFAPVKNEADALFKARVVGAKYLLLVTALRGQGAVSPYGRLWRLGTNHPVWEYNARDWNSEAVPDKEKERNPFKEFSVQVEGEMDLDSTARSIARSWAQGLATTGLRGLARNPRPDTSDVSPLQSPGLVIPSLAGTLAPPLREAALRDAIDREPERLELRAELFDEQVRNQDYSAAAFTAELASRIDPSETWKLRAAHAHALAGHTDRASALAAVVPDSALNEPRHAAMMGEVLLASGDYDRAVAAFSRSIDALPSPEALVGRAVANALSGHREACEKDLKAVTDAPGPRALAGYRLAVAKLDQATERLAVSLRELIPTARRKPNDPETLARAITLATKTDALAAAMTALAPPEMHKRSHALLGLACNLLGQASQEVLDLAQTGSTEQEAQANDSLQEALLQLPDHRAIFRDEVLTAGTPG